MCLTVNPNERPTVYQLFTHNSVISVLRRLDLPFAKNALVRCQEKETERDQENDEKMQTEHDDDDEKMVMSNDDS